MTTKDFFKCISAFIVIGLVFYFVFLTHFGNRKIERMEDNLRDSLRTKYNIEYLQKHKEGVDQFTEWKDEYKKEYELKYDSLKAKFDGAHRQDVCISGDWLIISYEEGVRNYSCFYRLNSTETPYEVVCKKQILNRETGNIYDKEVMIDGLYQKGYSGNMFFGNDDEKNRHENHQNYVTNKPKVIQFMKEAFMKTNIKSIDVSPKEEQMYREVLYVIISIDSAKS